MKMKRFLLFFILFITLTPQVFSQNKQLTIQDAVIGQWRDLYPEDLFKLQWLNAEEFVYVHQYTNLIKAGVESPDTSILLSLKELNQTLSESAIDELNYFPWEFTIVNGHLIFEHQKQWISVDINNKKIDFIIKTDKKADLFDFCEANAHLAYTIENNLYIASATSKTIQISKNVDKGIVSGSDYVHRQEFGIEKGTFWSPKGKYLAYYHKDETMVTDYPLVDIASRIATAKESKYPMAGMKSEEVTLKIYNIETRETITVETGEPKEQFLTAVTWDANGRFIYIGVLNRDQNHLKMNKYNAATGEFVKTLFEEKNSRYVEPEYPLFFLEHKPEQFIWQSERDGYNHLYLYNTEGKLIKQLTQGKWVVTKILGTDKKCKNLFFCGNAESPVEEHIYYVQISTGEIKKLSDANGVHEGMVSPDGRFVLDKYSNLQTPRIINLLDVKNVKIVRNLLTAPNPLKDYKTGEIEIVKIKAADKKTDLYGRLIKPVDFNPSKKYPVIVYVYGGPHLQQVRNAWLADTRMWQLYMAQKGYVMFTLDNRGTDNRGFEFESIIHRQLGQLEMKDQMQGIKYLKKLSYTDNDRIGIHGWSYGGFMTISLMTNYPETFKVGVAGGPVIDWKYYEVMYGERYMDTPQQNKEGYELTSLLNKAKYLKGKLLVIHGAVDPVVVWQNSLAFVRECVKNNIQLDYFVYPTHEHNVTGKDRVHLMQKVTMYFDDYLKN